VAVARSYLPRGNDRTLSLRRSFVMVALTLSLQSLVDGSPCAFGATGAFRRPAIWIANKPQACRVWREGCVKRGVRARRDDSKSRLRNCPFRPYCPGAPRCLFGA